MMEFSLRPWEPADRDSLVKYANNQKIAANLRDGFPFPYTALDAESFLLSCVGVGEERQCARAIEIGGEAVGSVGVFLRDDIYRKSAEIGYWLAEPFWGRGVMTAAVRQMRGLAFDRYDIVRLFAEPFARNTASRRVLEGAGFVLEGVLKKNAYKNGEFLDSCIYAYIV